jgi:uncharacterized protein
VTAARSVPLDALRGFALAGVIIVNAPFFGQPLWAAPVASSGADAAALWATLALAAGKFFLMFSFLFGFGLARQFARAQSAGQPGHGLVLRRMAGLFVFGALHATLLFFGDILMLYAALGCLAWACRRAAPRRLLVAAGVALAVAIPVQASGILGLEPLAFVAPGSGPGYLGSFADGVRQRIADLPIALGFGLRFNALPALAMVLAGYACGALGWVPPDAAALRRLRRPARVALGLAGGASAVLVALAAEQPAGAGIEAWTGAMAFCALAPPLAFGMAVTVVDAATRHPDSRVVRALAVPGRATLTGYILHSVILGAVFNGWGLGLYGQVGPAGSLLVGIATFCAVALLIAAWQRRFRHGPEEWLLRSFAALAWQPFRREGADAARPDIGR